MISPLTSLRFFAVVLVYFWHVNFLKDLQSGYIAVSFFYVLSGFILTYNYHSKLKTLNKANVMSFYVGRFAKIYPMHIITLILTILLPLIFYGGYILERKQTLFNIFLLQSFYPDNKINFALNGPSWSLSDEMFFYLLFPFLLVIIFSITKKLNSIFIFGLMALVWLTTVLYQNHDVPLDYWPIYIFPLTRVIDFIMGIILAKLYLSTQDLINKFKSNAMFTVLEVISVVSVLLAIYFSKHIHQGIRFSTYYIPFWCLLIFVFSFQKGFISKVLSHRTLVLLGEASFSFYMIHPLVFTFVPQIFPKEVGYFHWRSYCLLVAILLSVVVYKYCEEPLRKKIILKYKQHNLSKKEEGLTLPGTTTIFKKTKRSV